ncbi:MAG: PAS domain-containing sensor histidine kinase [Armatimonadota bacterium]
MITHSVQSSHIDECPSSCRRFFQSLIDADLDILVLLSPDGVILTASDSLAGHVRQPISQLIGTHICEVFPEDVSRRTKDWIAQILRTRRPQRFDQQCGDILLAHYLFPLLDEDGQVQSIAFFAIDITAQQETALQLRHYQQQLLSLNVELMKAGERERRRIARQLHDNLSQILAFLCMKLDWLSKTDDVEGIPEALEELHGFAVEAMSATRKLTVELSPPVLFEYGLEAALYELPRFFRERYELTVHITGTLPALEEDIAISVYQCVRELLMNVLKHAQTKIAWIRLSEKDNDVTVEVRDDGVGFDVAQVYAGESFGLFSIRERIHLIGGTVELISAPGAGTTITITVPVKLHTQQVS